MPLDDPSKTKLADFAARTGSVLIKGYSRIGHISGVSVEYLELFDASSGQKQRGVVIEVSAVIGDSVSRIFVDYDEIDSLLKGIDYVAKVTGSPNNLEQFEATYETRDSLSITVFNELKKSSFFKADGPGKISVLVKGGIISRNILIFELPVLRGLIDKAKQMLDSLN